MEESLISRAYQVGKLSKQQAKLFIEEIYAKTEDSSTRYVLAGLYRAYLPPVPKVAKTPLDWVGKAVSKDKSRFYLNHIHYDADNQIIVATDGLRLHFTDYKVGSEKSTYISFCGNPINMDGAFPDYKRIIPEPKRSISVNIDTLDIVLETPKNEREDYFYAIDTPHSGIIHIKKKYMDEALSGMKVFDMEYDDNTRPVKIKHELGTAVIMPLDK